MEEELTLEPTAEPTTGTGEYSEQLEIIIQQQYDILGWLEGYFDIFTQGLPLLIGTFIGMGVVGAFWYWSLRGV